MDEAFYSVDGLRLRYLEWGKMQSEPIVLVHGYSSTADAWANVGEVLGVAGHLKADRRRRALSRALEVLLPVSWIGVIGLGSRRCIPRSRPPISRSTGWRSSLTTKHNSGPNTSTTRRSASPHRWQIAASR